MKEFSNFNEIKFIDKIEWDLSLKSLNNFEFKENFYEQQEMYNALVNFYKYGFVIFKKVPTKNNFIINFANLLEVFEEQTLENFLMLNQSLTQMT